MVGNLIRMFCSCSEMSGGVDYSQAVPHRGIIVGDKATNGWQRQYTTRKRNLVIEGNLPLQLEIQEQEKAQKTP